MFNQCKHCGRRYSQAKGRGAFCCLGCEHVYGLIQETGFEDYYDRQDRAGKPVGDRPFRKPDFVSIRQIQTEAEKVSGNHVTLNIEGMSCMGCAWLIEHLAKRQPGVVSARVALSSNLLRLEWERGKFDLCALADALHDFGYKVLGNVGFGGSAFSPLATRLGLTLIFSLNGILLGAALTAGIGGEGLRQLYILLIGVCLLFLQLIGGAVFLKPAWSALLLRRLDSDAVPAMVGLVLLALALAQLLYSGTWTEYVLLYFIIVPAMVFARWLTETLALKMPRA